MTTPFGGHRQPLAETAEPSNGVACSRTTGFYLNPIASQQLPQEYIDVEEMVWHDESPSISAATIPGSSQHFYPSNFPLPPHL